MFGKKKPWDYNTTGEKIDSVLRDYRTNEKVLKKVIKKEPEMIVKVHAANALFSLKQLPDNPMALTTCLIGDVGLSETEARELLQAIGELYLEMERQGRV